MKGGGGYGLFCECEILQLKTRSTIVIGFRSRLTIGLGICGVEIYDCQISLNLGDLRWEGVFIANTAV